MEHYGTGDYGCSDTRMGYEDTQIDERYGIIDKETKKKKKEYYYRYLGTL